MSLCMQLLFSDERGHEREREREREWRHEVTVLLQRLIKKAKSSYFACTIILYKELFYKVRDIRNKFKKRLYQTSYLLWMRKSFGIMKKSFSPDSVSVQNLILTFLGHSVLNFDIKFNDSSWRQSHKRTIGNRYNT